MDLGKKIFGKIRYRFLKLRLEFIFKFYEIIRKTILKGIKCRQTIKNNGSSDYTWNVFSFSLEDSIVAVTVQGDELPDIIPAIKTK